jgi:photosystem II stability/assembly factor-like uncharacterized protein
VIDASGLPDRRSALRGAVLSLLLLAASARASVVIKDNLYGVKALSPTDVWAVGNFGSIYHSADGGATWERRESGTKSPLFGVDFADATHGWAVGKSALVLRTDDAGRNWKRQKTPIPPEKHLFGIAVIDARTAWAVGDWGAIIATHDGGATWEDRSLGALTIKEESTPERQSATLTDDVVLYDISFPDAKHGFIAGEFGTILVTRDGGETWERRSVGTEKTLFGVTFTTPETGWAVGIDGLIIRTRDGGDSWDVQRGRVGTESLEELGFVDTIKNPALYSVRVSGREGVVAGDTGILLLSHDGGETWERNELPEKQRLVWMRSVSLAPGASGCVVGSGGFAAQIARGGMVLPDGGRATPAAP